MSNDTPEQLRIWSNRCTRLSRAVATGDRNEFTMRVPAEPDRDADLVLSSVAVALDRYADLLDQIAAHERVCAGVWVPVRDVEPPYEDCSVIRTVDGDLVDGMHYWPAWTSEDGGPERPPTWENDEGTFVLKPDKVTHVFRLKPPNDKETPE